MSHRSLWQCGASYLIHCPTQGLARLEILLQSLPTGTEARINKIIDIARDNNMPHVGKIQFQYLFCLKLYLRKLLKVCLSQQCMQDPRNEEHKTRKTGQCSHVGAQSTRWQFHYVHCGSISKILCGTRRVGVSRFAGKLGFLHVSQRQTHIFR